MSMNMNPNNDFDVNAQGVEVMANNVNLPSVLFDQDGIQVTNTKLPFGDEDVKAEEYNSPKRWRDQVAETATLLGITGSTRNKKFLIAGLGSAALLALAGSVPSMKESHVNKNSAAAVPKPASAKSSKVPFAKVTKAKAPKAKASGSDSPSLAPSDGPTLGPSLAPSNYPSLGPSLSLAPSNSPTLGPSLSPSNSPTLAPSLTPSKSGGPTSSLAPSDKPSQDPLSLYDFVGNGFCADLPDPQISDVFPYVVFDKTFGSAASSPSACASKCTECVSVNGALSGGSFRGFVFEGVTLPNGVFIGNCFCLLDYGATYNPGAGGEGCNGYYADYGIYSGTGEILGVYDLPNQQTCYKSKLPEE